MKRLTAALGAVLLGLVLAVPAASHDNGGHGGHGDGSGPPCDDPTIIGSNGTPGDDVIRDNNGSNTIYAGAGDDRVCGNRGSDTIVLGPGHDYGQGNHGADTIIGGDGHDRATGGAGGGDTCDAEHVNEDSCEN